MNNMDQIIKAHNNKITNPSETPDKPCNCKIKQSCPLNGACQATNIVYKAEVIDNKDPSPVNKITYIGTSQPTFKERLSNHKNHLNTKNMKKKQNSQNTFGV